MTNEEILKRFEFELELGLFKSIIVDSFVIIPFVLDDYDLFLITTIIEKLGYNVYKNSFSIEISNGISIYPKNKVFWYFNIGPEDYEYIEKYNSKLPDYIFEYKKEDDYS